MSTEPWGCIRWVGLERACEACIRAAGLVAETGRSGVAPDHGLITIRLADQPVPMTEPAEAAPSRVGVIDLPPGRTRQAPAPVRAAPPTCAPPGRGFQSAGSSSRGLPGDDR